MSGQWVYYAERHGLIKVGISYFPQHRVARQLKAALLAAEPGTWATERARHAQFAHLRVQGEWFTPGPELLEHVQALGPAPVNKYYPPLQPSKFYRLLEERVA